MKGERTTLAGEAFIFAVFWIIAIALWGMWLNGVWVPLIGLLTAIVFRLSITWIRYLDTKF